MVVIKLQSSDDEIFEIDLQVAMCFGILKSMMESCDVEDEVVPLPKVNSFILRKILEWAEHHKSDLNQQANDDDNDDDDDDDDNDDIEEEISAWDIEFFQVEQSTLFELLLAANYLNIQALRKVACKTVANMIKGKTAEDIRQTFNIQNDFNLAEDTLERKKNKWNIM